MFRAIAIFMLIISALIVRAQGLKPNADMALLKGKVTNFKGKPLANETILFFNEKTKAIYKSRTDAAGKFEMLVATDASYVLKYKDFTMDREYTRMLVPADEDATYEVEIKLDPPKEFVLNNVYFETGKSTLKPASNKALNDLVEILKIKNAMLVEIQGHTDNEGTDEDNLKLSQQRAEAVRKYLVQKGIDAARVMAKGYGATQPVADNGTPEGRSRNRRTSVKVLKD